MSKTQRFVNYIPHILPENTWIAFGNGKLIKVKEFDINISCGSIDNMCDIIDGSKLINASYRTVKHTIRFTRLNSKIEEQRTYGMVKIILTDKKKLTKCIIKFSKRIK